MGVFVARESGDILYSKRFRCGDLNLDLMSNFLSALSMFGEENLGKIKRIAVEGLDVEMSVFAKHGLILVILYHPNMVQDYLDEEADLGLDRFYDEFKCFIKANINNQTIYQHFDNSMAEIIYKYLMRIKAL